VPTLVMTCGTKRMWGGTYGSYLSAYDQPFLFVGFVVEDAGVCWERDNGSSCLFSYSAGKLGYFVDA
jgi:hypothetical protein